MVRLPRKASRRGGTARHPGLHQDNIPILVARDRTGHLRASWVDGVSVSLALAGRHAGQSFIGDGGKAIATFARRAGIPFHVVPAPGKRTLAARTCTSTTSTPTRPSQAMAQPLQRRRHQEPAQLSRLAARSRSLGRQTRTAKLDQRRNRKWTIPTDNAIRATIACG